MNRRGFFKAVIAGAATVAIGMKMAHSFPLPVAGNTIRSDTSGPFKYFMDIENPRDVSVYFTEDKTFSNPLSIDVLNTVAGDEHRALQSFKNRADALNLPSDHSDCSHRSRLWPPVGYHRVDTSYDTIPLKQGTECLELCAEVSMSQGMAQHNLDGYQGWGIEYNPMDYAQIPLAQIRT